MFGNFNNHVFVDAFNTFANAIETDFKNLRTSSVEATEDGWRLELIVPGFTKKEIEIKVENGTLNIKGNVSEEETSKLKMPFDKSYSLPKTAKIKKIEAKIEAGILTVNVIKEKTEEKVDIKIS